VTISTATQPFNKTLLIQILPRYVLINQLSKPLVIKQQTQTSQLLLKGSPVPFYFQSKKDLYLMLRQPSKDELIGLSMDKPLYQDLAAEEFKFWSSPF
jgi:hypothetical protein